MSIVICAHFWICLCFLFEYSDNVIAVCCEFPCLLNLLVSRKCLLGYWDKLGKERLRENVFLIHWGWSQTGKDDFSGLHQVGDKTKWEVLDLRSGRRFWICLHLTCCPEKTDPWVLGVSAGHGVWRKPKSEAKEVNLLQS